MIEYKVSVDFLRPSEVMTEKGNQIFFRKCPKEAILLAIIEDHNE
jgi:hypothetical protein